MSFNVKALKDLQNIIIPFFDKYPLLTTKAMDYSDRKDLIFMTASKA